MLKILVKKQFAEIFKGYFVDSKKNRARSPLGVFLMFALYFVIMVGVFAGMFTYLSLSLCGAMAGAGMAWLYFAVMGLLAVVLGIFGSVFSTYSTLYLSKDNDLLLSMPIPVNTILAARLVSVYLMGLIYSAAVVVPSIIVYWVVIGISASAVIGGLVLVLLLSLFVLVLSCILGWGVARLSVKLKGKSYVSTLLSLAFIAAYYFFYFKAQTLIKDLILNAVTYGELILDKVRGLYYFGSIALGDGRSMAICGGIVAALVIVTLVLLSRSFLRIVTATGSVSKKVYREKVSVTRSVDRALLAKEFGRFTSSTNYMINCGLGILFVPAFGILYLFKGSEVFTQLVPLSASYPGSIPVLAALVLCAASSMNDMAAPSVSLEGKNLWIPKSLPVTPWQVLRAKLRMQLILTLIPTLVSAVCFAAVLPATLPERILGALLPLSFAVFSASLALAAGVRLPNLTWTNEIVPIKQSACVTVGLFACLLYPVALGLIYFLAASPMGAAAFLAAAIVLTAGISLFLLRWLKTRGVALFASL